MDRAITIKGQRYILASSLLAEERLRVLKHQETFGIFDRFGEISTNGEGEEGIFFEGTRFLSRLDFLIGNFRPLLLNSNIRNDNQAFAVDLTNPDFRTDQGQQIPRGSVHIRRRIFVCDHALFEKVELKNFFSSRIPLTIKYNFDADFAGIFEVRGYKRKKTGLILPARWDQNKILLSYEGLDHVLRRTRISFDHSPTDQGPGSALFSFNLNREEQSGLHLRIEFSSSDRTQNEMGEGEDGYKCCQHQIETELSQFRRSVCQIESSNDQFNDWLNRSLSDLNMLMTTTPHGIYPYAGVPWFSTTFGRDGIITALQMLWIYPEVAKGVLCYLAHTQANELDPSRDSAPGKILHESRKGEMATLKEIPFQQYYGSVDSTPLFLVLAGEYLRVTGDLQFIHSIWPQIRESLGWIDNFGDLDGDGFVEYARQSKDGLIHQGWKDSHDSIFHGDGSDASSPVALCEVQGYVYQGKLEASFLAEALGERELSQQLIEQAYGLKENFHQKFWCEDLGTFALALDANKARCRVIASNAGHCLFSGIVKPEYSEVLIQTLVSKKLFCGWGIRTLSQDEIRYNPMSYHNGSIWPHDNALIAAGAARYGRRDVATQILTGLFEASRYLDLNRLPELFCGFEQVRGEGPTLYPLSCAPQAWSAAAVFLILQSCLGLTIDANRRQIVFDRPSLPEFLKILRIKNLRIHHMTVDLEIVRLGFDTGVNILDRQGSINVVVLK
ncbi:MAG: amylo-alpha-1,6-glucosidase [Bdellovibrio sp.]|nr:MAG: amylo-alpha-1,6-glucosidase [Bdellovibrio sp.]